MKYRFPENPLIEIVESDGMPLARVKSGTGYPAYYPIKPAEVKRPVLAVLMDLDGTSVKSERFWMTMIQSTISSLTEIPGFRLEEADFPYVSGRSVSEHLRYCIDKYCPGRALEEAAEIYYALTRRKLKEIREGKTREESFMPAPGLKKFLCGLKRRKIKTGLVTSGLYEKAWPEISEAFRVMELGPPDEFYDVIITGGIRPEKGRPGTLGELEAKPHPWLYAEAARTGLGIPYEERARVICVEDSMAGIVSIRLAGFYAVALPGGNIEGSPLAGLVNRRCKDFEDITGLLDEKNG